MLLENLLESLLQFYFNLTSSYGVSIILLSLSVTVLLYPLKLISDLFKRKVEIKKSIMQLELDKLNDVTNKIERFYYTRRIYKQFKYNPLYSLVDIANFLYQIPFLFAAYHLLSNYPPLNGVSFSIINDLSKADQLIFIKGFSINLLPILMTLISLFGIFLNRQTINKSGGILLSFTSLCFFVIIYNSSAAIVLFWVMNTIYSFGTLNFLRSKYENNIKNILAKYVKSAYNYIKSNFYISNFIAYIILIVLFGLYATKPALLILLQVIVLTAVFIALYLYRNSRKIYHITLSIALLVFVICFFDNLIIPHISIYLRLRYILIIIFLLCLFIYKGKNSLLKVFSFFIAINFVSLLLMTIIQNYKEPYPKFKSSNTVQSDISIFIDAEVNKNKNIIVICLDGYPASNILMDKYQVKNNLNSILTSYNSKKFYSNFISTPISLTNLLFDVNFEKNTILDLGANEISLFQDAYSASTLFPINQNKYDEYWNTFIASDSISSVLGFSYWRPFYPMRSLNENLYNIYIGDFTHKYNDKITNYNDFILNKVSKDIKKSGNKKKFIFAHFLTFHLNVDLKTKISSANSIVSNIIKIIPNEYSVLFFSDHGLRNDEFDMIEKKSAIFYEKKSN
jgi:membrane protein insertase Oxa1/YidC/SpoIIIJ